MANIRISSILLICICFCSMFIILSLRSSNEPQDIKGLANNSQEHKTLRKSYISSVLHIDDKDHGDYNWSKAVEQSWCNGSGTDSDPYVINNLTVTSNNTQEFCLIISNSTSNVIVSNSIFGF